MSAGEALAARHASRVYKPQAVPREVLARVIEAATRAPSWGNTQPWEVFIAAGETMNAIRGAYLANLRDQVAPRQELGPIEAWPAHVQQRYTDRLMAICEALGVDPADPAGQQAAAEGQMAFFGAPATIFLCSHPGLEPWSLFDLGALAQSIMLVAVEEGLSTIPAFSAVSYPEVLRRELEIPDDYRIVIGIEIGYEDETNPMNTCRSARRPIDEVLRIKGA